MLRDNGIHRYRLTWCVDTQIQEAMLPYAQMRRRFRLHKNQAHAEQRISMLFFVQYGKN